MNITKESLQTLNRENLTLILNNLKSIYNFANIDESRKNYIVSKVQKYGYLPYPHVKSLEELTAAETLLALEEKLKFNNTYKEEKLNFSSENISPAIRAGYKNSQWLNKEGHSIKLINLAGLGNGNASKEPGKFIDWLKQLIILPAGNLEKEILSTTMYLIPFHPREFGCAYLPKSSEVSENLEDSVLKEKLDIDAKNQVRLFIALAQLAGHPVIYDVLPQTGRFSKTVLAQTFIARWFDIKELNQKLYEEIEKISLKLAQHHNFIFVERVKTILQEELLGVYIPLTEDIKEVFKIFNKELLKKKKEFSNSMLTKENQEILSQRAKNIVCSILEMSADAELTEQDITSHGEIIGELIKEGLWPSPGGAWCSSGVPVYDKMSEGGGHPMFKHFDNKNKDVTNFANLDCQTPYYFFYFDKKEYNQKVIDFYVDFLKNLRNDYNFDGFRVDHIDHIVDEVSEFDGLAISYRAPRKVLGLVNEKLKKEVPHFAILAEYMLWDNFFREYHVDMNFDLLWGSDIISQYQKTVSRIVEENKNLQEYNNSVSGDRVKLSILKTYNNQDGEFREINQYPGQLSEEGALFKWFKLKFLPGGKLANRPALYVDGDESFTKKGIESVIGEEISMVRNHDYEFFRKFDAINRLALNSCAVLDGTAKIIHCDEETGFVSWIVASESSKEGLFIVANQNPPTEVTRNSEGEVINAENNPICHIEAHIPEEFSVKTEYVLTEDSLDFEENAEISNLSGNKLLFEKLNPAEFHLYKICK